MKRRKFIQSGLVASAVPISCTTVSTAAIKNMEPGQELYEWRDYDIKWGGNSKLLVSYLKDVLKPALMAEGVNHFMVFEDINPSAEKKIRTLISYPNSDIYIRSQMMQHQAPFVSAAQEYGAVPVDKPIYNRFESSLLLAFTVQPQMLLPKPESSVFELRIYEGYSDDAVRRKIKMFNDGEIPIFIDAGLYPVFFGEMIAGPLRPCLVYMVNCKDMEAHTAGWQAFLKHPDWIAMRGKEEYANSVSNIRNAFLKVV